MARQLTGLDAKVKDIEGDDADFTYKQLIVRGLAQAGPDDPISVFHLGLKILDGGDEQTLEPHDFELVKAAIKAWGVAPWVRARALLYLEATTDA